MKHLSLAIAALFLAACAESNPNTSPGNSPKSAEQTAEPPVAITSPGITPDRKNVAFKIEARGKKPIIQVDVEIKEMDQRGKVLLNTTLLWQRKDCCPRKPLEQGVIYDVSEPMVEKGATTAQATVVRVHFQDGSSWAPKE
jgi:hypothetical protein